MSQYIQNEINRFIQKKKKFISDMKFLSDYTINEFDKAIVELASQCKHKEALSRRFDMPMGFCEYCETDMTKPIGQ